MAVWAGGTVATEAEGGKTKAVVPTPYVYRTVGKTKLRLWVFSPPAARRMRPSAKARPVIVFFFGGGFVKGRPNSEFPRCEHFARRGVVAVAADYRVQSRDGSTPPDSIADGRAAVRYLRAHAGRLGIDPNRIAAAGSSAGAVTAACLGCIGADEADRAAGGVSSRPNAMVLFSAQYAYAPIAGKEYRRPERLALYRKRWGSQDMPRISAYHHLDANAPPALLLHGEADAICPVAAARLFAEKMKRLGRPCRLVTYPGGPHGFHRRGPAAGRPSALQEADRFLVGLAYLPSLPTAATAPAR